MKPLHFKVKTGYGPNDYISIGQDEYSKAVRAQINKSVVIFKDHGSLSGSNIQSVLPDWNKELGYYPDYKLTGQDMDDIPKLRQSEYRDFTQHESKNVERQLQGLLPLERIESPNRIHTNGPTTLSALLPKP